MNRSAMETPAQDSDTPDPGPDTPDSDTPDSDTPDPGPDTPDSDTPDPAPNPAPKLAAIAGRTRPIWIPIVSGLAAAEIRALGPENPTRTEPAFPKIERALLEAKSAMDPYDGGKPLEKVLNLVDLYGRLKQRIAHDHGGQAVTNAWLKFYELFRGAVGQELIHPPADRDLRVFFNAEFPGGFISAAHHDAETREFRLDWVASSLCGPTAVIGDTYGFYQHNRGRWLMGPHIHNGDVRSPAVVMQITAQVLRRFPGGVDLYTADGGVCVTSYAEGYRRQEEINSELQYGQVVCGLLVLARGGTLIAKLYTFTHLFTVTLLAFLASVFERFQVVKPLASRAANSEVYAVGTGFRGIPDMLASLLLARLGQIRKVGEAHVNSALLTPEDLQKSGTLRPIHAAADTLARQQIGYLADMMEVLALRLADKSEYERTRVRVERIAMKAQDAYLTTHDVLPLPPGRKLASHTGVRTGGRTGGPPGRAPHGQRRGSRGGFRG